MSDDDAQLVALIDNELDDSSRTALLARLQADELLRRRYEDLRQTGEPLATALDSLLENAPLARLRATLLTDKAAPTPLRRFAGFAIRDLAAGLIVGALAAGSAIWAASNFGFVDGREDWRTAIAEYAHLYTDETFTPFNPNASMQATELSAVGTRVGANLTPENVTLPGLRFTTAFMLAYDGAPLGVIAYVDPSGEPVLLCIIANDAPDATMRSKRRDDLSLAWWSQGGRSRLVIGRIPEAQAVAFAQALEKRI